MCAVTALPLTDYPRGDAIRLSFTRLARSEEETYVLRGSGLVASELLDAGERPRVDLLTSVAHDTYDDLSSAQRTVSTQRGRTEKDESGQTFFHPSLSHVFERDLVQR